MQLNTRKTSNFKVDCVIHWNTIRFQTKIQESQQNITSKRPIRCVSSYKSCHWWLVINTAHCPGFAETTFWEKGTCFSAEWTLAPFQQALCLLCFCASSSPPPPPSLRTVTGMRPPSITNGWKEKQIRSAGNSEADSPSLTVQKENSSNERCLLPSVEGLDHEWVARGITREHGVFWMQYKHRISKQALVLRQKYCAAHYSFSWSAAKYYTTAFWIVLHHLNGQQITFLPGSYEQGVNSYYIACFCYYSCKGRTETSVSVEESDLHLIHSNKLYHVCAHWHPVLH